jgi:two-component system, NtrC family, response regulator GlrR
MADTSEQAGLYGQARVLLLNLDPRGGNEKLLTEVLNSLPNTSIELLKQAFNPDEFSVSEVSRVVQALNPDLMLLILSRDLVRSPRHWARLFKREVLITPAIVVIEPGHPEDLIDLMKSEMADFIVPPFNSLEVFGRLCRVLNRAQRTPRLNESFTEKLGLEHLVGEAPAFLRVIERVRLLAHCDVGIIISGETGTGKELIARSIHYLSHRSSKPFVPVNCGAIPVDLVENELFGHKKGAFTGASNQHQGLIQEANGGTIFLDEIDSLPLLAQVKLLRFLQCKEYRPLGSSKTSTADVRMIAASNANLEEAVSNGKLRRDFYYRLNVVPVTVPPLRERRGDVPVLAKHFLRKYSKEFRKTVTGFSPEAMQTLYLYEWPGNVRELEHAIERAVILCDRQIISSSHLVISDRQALCHGSFQEMKIRVVSQFERSYVESLLETYQGNITKAARAAQKERRTFWELIRKYNINVQRFRRDQRARG